MTVFKFWQGICTFVGSNVINSNSEEFFALQLELHLKIELKIS